MKSYRFSAFVLGFYTTLVFLAAFGLFIDKQLVPAIVFLLVFLLLFWCFVNHLKTGFKSRRDSYFALSAREDSLQGDYRSYYDKIKKYYDAIDSHKSTHKKLKSKKLKDTYQQLYKEINYHCNLFCSAFLYSIDDNTDTPCTMEVSLKDDLDIDLSTIDNLMNILARLDRLNIMIDTDTNEIGTELIDDIISSLKELSE